MSFQGVTAWAQGQTGTKGQVQDETQASVPPPTCSCPSSVGSRVTRGDTPSLWLRPLFSRCSWAQKVKDRLGSGEVAPVSQQQVSPGQQVSGISQDNFSWGLSELPLNMCRLFRDGEQMNSGSESARFNLGEGSTCPPNWEILIQPGVSMRSQATALGGKGGETDKRSWRWKGIAAPDWSERRFYLRAGVSGCSIEHLQAAERGKATVHGAWWANDFYHIVHGLNHHYAGSLAQHWGSGGVASFTALQSMFLVLQITVCLTSKPQALPDSPHCLPTSWAHWPPCHQLPPDRLPRPRAKTPEETCLPESIKCTHTPHVCIFGCLLVGNYKFQTLQKLETLFSKSLIYT